MNIQCHQCGTHFNSGFNFVNSTNITFENNTTSCPNCGAFVAVPNGKYNFDERGIETLLSDPEFTQDRLIRLRDLTVNAQRYNYSADKFKKEAEKITPKAGLLAKQTPLTFSDRMAFYSLLAMIIFGLIGAYQNSKDKSSPTVVNHVTVNNYNTPPPSPKPKRQIKKAKKIKPKPEKKENELSQKEALRMSKKFKSIKSQN